MENFKLTNRNLWTAAMVFGGISLLLVASLLIGFPAADYARAGRAVILTSGVLWGALAIALSAWGWNVYYRYFYPEWSKPLAPLSALLYAGIAVGMWVLSTHFGGAAPAWFAILGGLEGILEHILGIFALRILHKVPWLQGISIAPVLAFSFFEYTFYWSLTLWAVFLVSKLLPA